MARRLILGPILIALVLAVVWLDDVVAGRPLSAGWRWLSPSDGLVPPGLVILALGLVVCTKAGGEIARMFIAMGIHASRRHLGLAGAAGVLAGGLTIGHAASGPIGPTWRATALATIAAAVVFLSMIAYIRHRDLKGAASAVASAVFAFVYAGVLIGFLLAIRREHGVFVLVAVVMTIKSCDIGAYFTGVAVGKHKLIPWISPGKTWEGLFGGVLVSGAVSIACLEAGKQWAGEGGTLGSLAGVPWWFAGALGMVLGAAGQAGDLSASVLKRDAGVKDAGKILPGFGGVVDVIDSLVIAGPVAYWGLAVAAAWWSA